MNRIPFSVYDFFGYLSTGFLIMVAVDFVSGSLRILGDNPTVALGIVWIVIAYISGQIIANPSAWLLKRMGIKHSTQRLGRYAVKMMRKEGMSCHMT